MDKLPGACSRQALVGGLAILLGVVVLVWAGMAGPAAARFGRSAMEMDRELTWGEMTLLFALLAGRRAAPWLFAIGVMAIVGGAAYLQRRGWARAVVLTAACGVIVYAVWSGFCVARGGYVDHDHKKGLLWIATGLAWAVIVAGPTAALIGSALRQRGDDSAGDAHGRTAAGRSNPPLST